jgi:hypothetical protein
MPVLNAGRDANLLECLTIILTIITTDLFPVLFLRFDAERWLRPSTSVLARRAKWRSACCTIFCLKESRAPSRPGAALGDARQSGVLSENPTSQSGEKRKKDQQRQTTRDLAENFA